MREIRGKHVSPPIQEIDDLEAGIGYGIHGGLPKNHPGKTESVTFPSSRPRAHTAEEDSLVAFSPENFAPRGKTSCVTFLLWSFTSSCRTL